MAAQLDELEGRIADLERQSNVVDLDQLRRRVDDIGIPLYNAAGALVGVVNDLQASTNVTLTRSGKHGKIASAGGGANHNFLSATHPDTTAAAVTAGAVLRGNAAGTFWESLAAGAGATVLTMVAGVPAWAAAAGGGASTADTYVTIGNPADLTAALALTAGSGVSVTQAGANPTKTVTLALANLTANWAQAGAFDIYHAGAMNVGASTAPDNVTPGDVTCLRFFVAPFTGLGQNPAALKFYVTNGASQSPFSAGDLVNFVGNWAPATSAGNLTTVRITTTLDSTAAGANAIGGLTTTWMHNSGAFGMTTAAGSLNANVGIDSQFSKAIGGTLTAYSGVRSFAAGLSAGAVTSLFMFESRLATAAGWTGGAITTFTHYNIATVVPTTTTFATERGLNIPNLGGTNKTNAIGIDIAKQTGAVTLNLGIRNAATTVFTPSAQQSIAVTAPIVVDASVVQISTTTAANMTATPTIADGVDGQVVTITNTGTNTWTLQDQGTLAGSNMRLVAATVAVATRQSIKMRYSSTVGDWVQDGPLIAVI